MVRIIVTGLSNSEFYKELIDTLPELSTLVSKEFGVIMFDNRDCKFHVCRKAIERNPDSWTSANTHGSWIQRQWNAFRDVVGDLTHLNRELYFSSMNDKLQYLIKVNSFTREAKLLYKAEYDPQVYCLKPGQNLKQRLYSDNKECLAYIHHKIRVSSGTSTMLEIPI